MNRKYGMVLFCIVLHYVACLFISLAFHVTLVNISLNIDDSGRTSWWKETGPSPGKPSTIDRLLRGLPGYDMRWTSTSHGDLFDGESHCAVLSRLSRRPLSCVILCSEVLFFRQWATDIRLKNKYEIIDMLHYEMLHVLLKMVSVAIHWSHLKVKLTTQLNAHNIIINISSNYNLV